MVANLKLFKLYSLILLSSLLVVNCSSGEPTEDELETTDDENAALENDNYSENQYSQADGMEYGNELAEGDGEFVNNASADDLMDNMGNMGDMGNMGNNYGASQEVPMNNMADQSMMMNNVSANTVGMNGTPAVPMNTVPQSSQGARVKYVTAEGITVHNQPNGTVVETLSLGDHPLVWDESNWVKTSEGYYISQQALSDQPVGRTRTPTPWQ